MPRCDRDACDRPGVLRPVLFLAEIGGRAAALRLSPPLYFCPAHRESLHRLWSSRWGRAALAPLLEPIVNRRGWTLDWRRSRLFFAAVGEGQTAPAEAPDPRPHPPLTVCAARLESRP